MKRWIPFVVLLIVVVLPRTVAMQGIASTYRDRDLLVYPKRSSIPTEAPRRHKRSLDSLIATDLALVSTLDGSIRGIDRYAGNVYWTLQGGSGGSLIKSTAHFASPMTDESRSRDDDDPYLVFRDVLDDNDDRPWLNGEQQENGKLLPTSNGHEVYYIVEPQNGGTIYQYGEGKPLEQLPFTVENIVAHSPFQTDDGTMYIGSKSTLIIAIDPRTGKILRKFDLNQSRDAYLASRKRLPPHTIYLGRHEYKVGIFDDAKWWNLTYSEYIPNKLDRNIPAAGIQSDVYIAPDASGAITAIDVVKGDILWSLDLPHPVVSVFDVYRCPDYTISLSKQSPPKSLGKGNIGHMLQTVKRGNGLTTAYVGVHDGSLFALSTELFPLIRISDWASIYKGLPPGDSRRLLIEAGESDEPADPNSSAPGWKPQPHRLCDDNVDCLVGQHMIQQPPPPIAIGKGGEGVDMLPSTKKLPPTWQSQTGSFSGNTGKIWNSCILAMVIFLYIYRERVAYLWTVYVKPRLVQFQPSLVDFDTQPHGIPKDTSESSRLETDSTASNATPPVLHPSRAGIDLENFKRAQSGVLDLSETVLGYGSHGTVVYKGRFDGRDVAVKRLLIDFYDVALQEVKLLQESDDHANVIRYFYKEESDRFLYIALELCYGSLHDAMTRPDPTPWVNDFRDMDQGGVLRQIMHGIQHLHSLKIVHRDIKPHNILLAPAKHPTGETGKTLRVLISDFGLCKKLDGEQSSFHYTNQSPAGTAGWRAPELLHGALMSIGASDTSSSSKNARGTEANTLASSKATRAVDIFSVGCVFYYVLSEGEHPFGHAFEREGNVLQNTYRLGGLKLMGEESIEAKDLIMRMIAADPRHRPTAREVTCHPFFWSPTKRLAFLQDASDRFEVEPRDPPSPLLQQLESNSKQLIGGDWHRKIDRVVVADLQQFRKYDGKRVRDLLRAIRNKKHHWQDLPDAVKEKLGEPPDQYLVYFTARFPHLLLHAYYVLAEDAALTSQGSLREYFN